MVAVRALVGDGLAHLRLQLSLTRSLWLPMIVSSAAEFAWALGQSERSRVIAGAVVVSAMILTLAQTGTSPVDDRVNGRRAMLHVNGATARGSLVGLTVDALLLRRLEREGFLAVEVEDLEDRGFEEPLPVMNSR